MNAVIRMVEKVCRFEEKFLERILAVVGNDAVVNDETVRFCYRRFDSYVLGGGVCRTCRHLS